MRSLKKSTHIVRIYFSSLLIQGAMSVRCPTIVTEKEVWTTSTNHSWWSSIIVMCASFQEVSDFHVPYHYVILFIIKCEIAAFVKVKKNYMWLLHNWQFCISGHMLMFTSPEDPYVALPRLRSRDSRSQGLLKGYYRMAGNQVNFHHTHSWTFAPFKHLTNGSERLAGKPIIWMQKLYCSCICVKDGKQRHANNVSVIFS